MWAVGRLALCPCGTGSQPQARSARLATHGCVLHTSVSTAGPHMLTLPDVTRRVRICVPPPHDAEHTPQPDHDEKTHEEEHEEVVPWHVCACTSSTPPHAGEVEAREGGIVRRTRVWVPGPHGLLQSDHTDQSDTGQGSDDVTAGQSTLLLPQARRECTHDGCDLNPAPYMHRSTLTNL